MQITARDYQPLAEENEGRYAWMYLDTRHNVTVGIGHLLPSPAAAEALPFVDADTGQPASSSSFNSNSDSCARTTGSSTWTCPTSP